ncbi:PAS domain-containing sensor histidine kinase [Neorhodopirellula pilleata]|uniref:PAS domain-containing sensor histidine kinase n=1 Tax=Neorhodopirellula pilleata TaxID=2714738 RepID=UPI001E5B3922|nr:PAS domain-containing sensor histidine kinase [Neorhodopirellula pilleata]
MNSFQTSATYRALANSLPLSLLIKARDGRRVFANEAYLTWRGLQWDEVVGKTDRELFPESIASQYIADDQRVMETGQSTHAVEQTRIADGSLGWIERVKSPVCDAHGKAIGIQVLFWDVTARIVAEQTIKFEQSLLTTLLQSIPDSIYFKDTESRFIRVSRAMATKFGHADVHTVHGRTDADIFTPDHAKQARDDEVHIIETGQPLVDRIERETWHDRDDTWCLTTKMPLRDSDGKIIGTFGISRDITDLKKSEAALKEAVRMADAANRAKSEFLANMSHEIRTPMNAMVGMADLLAQTELDETQRDYVDTIRRSSDSLLRLLNDILDFSKIEARRLELEAVPFSLGYEVQAALSTLRLQASEKNLKLKFEQDEQVPSHFIGDPGRLRQVLVNLIGNAVKFTDVGGVTVKLHRQVDVDVQDGKCMIRLSVSDTGIGIPADQQAAVLAPFTQADASMTRRFGGTGLGLSISRQLVELMGGSLQLHSEVGAGTTFFFDLELPIAEVPDLIQRDGDREDDLGEAADIGLTPLRVLVAEDGITNQHVIAGLLRSLGHECSIASDGRETLVKWRNEQFDLILMDMHMPVMDGLEATEAIRQQELGTEYRIPIIALTAAAMAEDAKACRAAGMDDYLTKPIHRRRLQQVLAKYYEPIRAREKSPRIAATPTNVPIGKGAPSGKGASSDSSDDLALSAVHAGCLDLDSARSRIPGGVSGVMRLATVFRGECESLVDQLMGNLRAGENDTARRNAHTLKGACGLLGAKQLQLVATEIETAGREERLSDLDEAARLSSSLQTEAGRVIAAIDELLQPLA